MDRNDTIAAVATPPGNGGISIVRLSGPEAESVLFRLFTPAASEDRRNHESHRLMYGRLRDGEETVDECMAVLMRAPRSYTREDVAEIHLHGGTYVAGRALELCLREGARLAENGLTVAVRGTALFRAEDIAASITRLHRISRGEA